MFDRIALKNVMAMQGIGVKALSVKAGVNYDTLVRILNAGRTPNLVTVGKLAAALNVQPKDLMKED